MSYDLSFDKRSAVLLGACGALIAILLVAAGVLIGIRHPSPALPTPAPNRNPDRTSSPIPSTAPAAIVEPQLPSAPLSKSPTQDNFVLQFGAFKDQANAQARVKALKEKSVTAAVFPIQDSAGRTFYTVRSGSYANASDAAAAARDLQRSTQEQVIIRPSQRF
jgi:septal ring-binding cell division protein DamX